MENGNQQQCNNCYGSGFDGKHRCITCNGSGWVNAIPLGMVCEVGGCKLKGKDYKRPKNLASKGWEDEPIHLCNIHALKLGIINSTDVMMNNLLNNGN